MKLNIQTGFKRKTITTVAVVVLTGLVSACSFNPEPVKPWQRGNFAKEVMKQRPHGLQAGFEEHAYSSKEGTAGGYGLGAGGCGCN